MCGPSALPLLERTGAAWRRSVRDVGGKRDPADREEVIQMSAAIVIAVVGACCIACGYGISRAIRRSKERHGEALQTR
jgi:hypothetical protein